MVTGAGIITALGTYGDDQLGCRAVHAVAVRPTFFLHSDIREAIIYVLAEFVR